MLTPTRELCIQVTQALRAYGARKGIDPVAVFGGAPIRTQQAQLRQGGQVVVGTVGRVLDLISRHSLVLHACRYVVLDEADEMLDLGFLEDVEKILALAPSSRQTALFSATMPTEIRKLAERHLYDPVTVKVKAATLTIDTVEQFYVEAKPQDKNETLVARARGRAARPGDRLRAHEDPLRAALPDAARQGHERQGAARRHEPGRARRRDDRLQGRPRRTILVATDVAARGLDISTVTHVVNFDVPTSPDVYVHRIGRTGRVGRSGPRDHVRRAAPAARPGGDRAPRVDEHRAVGGGRARRARRRRPSRARAATASRTTRSSTNGGGYTKLIANAGRHEGVEAADLIAAMTAGGLDGEAIRNVRVLERFALSRSRPTPCADRRARDRGPRASPSRSSPFATEEALPMSRSDDEHQPR